MWLRDTSSHHTIILTYLIKLQIASPLLPDKAAWFLSFYSQTSVFPHGKMAHAFFRLGNCQFVTNFTMCMVQSFKSIFSPAFLSRGKVWDVLLRVGFWSSSFLSNWLDLTMNYTCKKFIWSKHKQSRTLLLQALFLCFILPSTSLGTATICYLLQWSWLLCSV